MVSGSLIDVVVPAGIAAGTVGVTVGGAVTTVNVLSDTELLIVPSPSSTTGAVDVVITTTGGGITVVGGCTYTGAPGV